MIQSRPIFLGGQTTNRRIITNAQVLPKEEGVRAPSGLPSLGVLNQEDEPAECLASKARGAQFWESQRVVGNRNSTLRWHTQNLLQDSEQKQSIERSLGQTQLQTLLERRRRLELSTQGLRHRGQPFGEACCTTRTLASFILEISLQLISTGTRHTHQSLALVLGHVRPSN